MITGFNPTDMYAADHIRRVLQTFPGVFSGIGEFTIHKEFVSAKVAGEVASLQDPALDRLLDFAAEVGLVAIDPQRHRYALPEARREARVPRTNDSAVEAPSEHRHHLGPYRRWPRRAADSRSRRESREVAEEP